MLRPDVENVDEVDGSISVSHSFRHEINWGHVALGAALIYALYKVAGMYDNSGGDGDKMN